MFKNEIRFCQNRSWAIGDKGKRPGIVFDIQIMIALNYLLLEIFFSHIKSIPNHTRCTCFKINKKKLNEKHFN